MTDIERLGPEAVMLADELHDVYAEAFGRPPHNESPAQAAGWRDNSLPSHATRPGFRCVVARDGDEAVGFAYGYTGRTGQWWTDQIAALVPAELLAGRLGGHFEFVELAVRLSFERQGIGTALHDALLDGLPHRVALLSTTQADSAARRLYLRRGWQILYEPIFGNASLLLKDL